MKLIFLGIVVELDHRPRLYQHLWTPDQTCYGINYQDL